MAPLLAGGPFAAPNDVRGNALRPQPDRRAGHDRAVVPHTRHRACWRLIAMTECYGRDGFALAGEVLLLTHANGTS
jgi:hypothetical protein